MAEKLLRSYIQVVGL